MPRLKPCSDSAYLVYVDRERLKSDRHLVAPTLAEVCEAAHEMTSWRY